MMDADVSKGRFTRCQAPQVVERSCHAAMIRALDDMASHRLEMLRLDAVDRQPLPERLHPRHG